MYRHQGVLPIGADEPAQAEMGAGQKLLAYGVLAAVAGLAAWALDKGTDKIVRERQSQSMAWGRE